MLLLLNLLFTETKYTKYMSSSVACIYFQSVKDCNWSLNDKLPVGLMPEVPMICSKFLTYLECWYLLILLHMIPPFLPVNWRHTLNQEFIGWFVNIDYFHGWAKLMCYRLTIVKSLSTQNMRRILADRDTAYKQYRKTVFQAAVSLHVFMQ